MTGVSRPRTESCEHLSFIVAAGTTVFEIIRHPTTRNTSSGPRGEPQSIGYLRREILR